MPVKLYVLYIKILTNVLIFDCNLEISAHVRTKKQYLFFDLNKAFDYIKNKTFSPQKRLFFFTRAQHVLGYHLLSES